ncbi:MAG TPA: VOC family protein, partial [Elusimicrobiota bacterium]|nr:VOC family protein [Elusimicrobiota bacterium]
GQISRSTAGIQIPVTMLKRLSHASFGTTDLTRTIAFYQSMLDCSVAHEFRNASGELYGVFMNCRDGTFLEFFNEQSPKPPGGPFRHICFEVDDIEAAAARFRAAGYAPEVRRGRTDRILQFFVHDPDGTMLEFQQHDEQSVLLPFVQSR